MAEKKPPEHRIHIENTETPKDIEVHFGSVHTVEFSLHKQQVYCTRECHCDLRIYSENFSSIGAQLVTLETFLCYPFSITSCIYEVFIAPLQMLPSCCKNS